MRVKSIFALFFVILLCSGCTNSKKGRDKTIPELSEMQMKYIFDFGKKNSQHTINYILNINIHNGSIQNNFKTIRIDETEFFK